MSQDLSSAAVVIGALRVNRDNIYIYRDIGAKSLPVNFLKLHTL